MCRRRQEVDDGDDDDVSRAYARNTTNRISIDIKLKLEEAEPTPQIQGGNRLKGKNLVKLPREPLIQFGAVLYRIELE